MTGGEPDPLDGRGRRNGGVRARGPGPPRRALPRRPEVDAEPRRETSSTSTSPMLRSSARQSSHLRTRPRSRRGSGSARGCVSLFPTYSASGIRLDGARLVETHEQTAAYLLYEKGRTLLSVFMLPVPTGEVALAGARVSYRGHAYVTYEQRGYRTVSWSDGRAVFGLVSMLDYEALLECADRLRAERANQTRL